MSNNEENLSSNSDSFDSWCRTNGDEEVKYSFRWTIERFSKRQEENGQVILI